MTYRSAALATGYPVALLDIEERALPEAVHEAIAALAKAWEQHGSTRPAIVEQRCDAYVVDYECSAPDGEAQRAVTSLTEEISLGALGSTVVGLTAASVGLAGGILFAGGMAMTACLVGRRFHRRWRTAKRRRLDGRRALGAFITRDALVIRRYENCAYLPRRSFEGASITGISSVGPHHSSATSYYLTLHYRDERDDLRTMPLGFGGFSLEVATEIAGRLDRFARA